MRTGSEMNLSWGLLHAGLQTVLDTALDPVVVMDTDGMVIGWNAHAERLFGWSWEEARDQRLSDMTRFQEPFWAISMLFLYSLGNMLPV